LEIRQQHCDDPADENSMGLVMFNAQGAASFAAAAMWVGERF
jgi:hypothetical protein